LAEKKDGGVGLTTDQCIEIFTYASSISSVTPLFTGWVLDEFGPRKSSSGFNLLVSLGLFMFATAETQVGFIAGAVLFSSSGFGVQYASAHLSNLFPKNKGLAISLIMGSITLSFGVFQIFDLLWITYGIGYQSLFQGYAIIVGCSSLLSMIIWPDTPYDDVDNRDKTSFESSSIQIIGTRNENTTNLIIDSGHVMRSLIEDKFGSKKNDSVINQITTTKYFMLNIFYITTVFWANFYLATMVTEIQDRQLFIEDRQVLISYFTLFLSCGLAFSAFAGFLVESYIHGCTIIAVCALISGCAQMILLLLPKSEFIVVTSFFFYVMFRNFIFTFTTIYISQHMGLSNFGILQGIASALAGLVQPLFVPLALWASETCHDSHTFLHDCSEGKWSKLHLFQLFTLLLLLIVPAYDYKRNISIESSRKNLKMSPQTSEEGACPIKNYDSIS